MPHRRRDRPCGAEDTAARASATAGAAAAARRRTACEDGGATQVGGNDADQNIAEEDTAGEGAKAAGGKANALQRPLRPSEALAAVVGPGPLPRGEVVSKVWDYIKSNNLQNPENRREILADDTLRKVFGKDKVTMFEMNKHLARHLA